MRRSRILWLLLVAMIACLAGGGVAAADSASPSVGSVASSWSFEPGVLLGLVLLVWLYQTGTLVLWRRLGRWRGIGRPQLFAFAAAVSSLVIALISPIDGLADSLFSVHMAQHLILLLVAPPLLLLARFDSAIAFAFPPEWREGSRRWLRRPVPRRATGVLLHPATVWWTFAVVLWVWHMPPPYQAALTNAPIHALEHVSLLLIGLQFWHVVLRQAGQRTLPYQFAILFVFTTMLEMSILAALLTFSGGAWYPDYASPEAVWKVGALTDQRTGALLMWMTSNTAFLGVVAMLFVRWFALEERRADQPTATV